MESKAAGFVTYRLDSHHPPVLTEEEWLAWEELQERTNTAEDPGVSLVPSQTGAWRRVSDLVPEENKQQITLRLDADVLEFFRSTGRRYQTRINAALREYVAAQKEAQESGSRQPVLTAR
jgi:uncharacterized protein (DUF4415 family)